MGIVVCPMARFGKAFFRQATIMLKSKKVFVTKKGLINLRQQYEQLKQIKLAKIRSEFFQTRAVDEEYFTIEAKLTQTREMLQNSQLIKKPSYKQQGTIECGAMVLLESNREESWVKIVGSPEADPSSGWISNESPVGFAILGHKAGDVVVIPSPISAEYKIKAVKYL